MPLFDYSCAKCGHVEEVLQKRGDGPPAECPECSEKDCMTKDMSLPSFQLKGGGWYKDLYSSQPKDGKKGEGKESKKSEGKENKSAKSSSSSSSTSSSSTASSSTSSSSTASSSKGGSGKAA